MPEHEGTDMHESSGTPLTAEQQHALDELRAAAIAVDDAIEHRDEMQRQAESADVDVELILQAAGII